MTLSVTSDGDRSVIVTRRFSASPMAVFRAHTEADLLKKWLFGPDGWHLVECRSVAVPGGEMFFRWEDDAKEGFHLTGRYLEIDPGQRMVHVDRMHLPDPPPDNHVETLFKADGSGTRLVVTMTLPDAESLAQMLATGMEEGIGASYERLEAVLGTATS